VTTRHAAVVGAGIGGLAAALALTRVGVRVTVLERYESCPDGGLPIGLHGNAVRALRRLGVADAALGTAGLVQRAEIRDRRDRLIAGIGGNLPNPTAPLAAIVLRRSLLSALSSPLGSGCIRFGAACTGVTDHGGEVAVHVEGSEDVQADLLVGADGLRSRVRGGRGHVQFTGATAWRGIGRGMGHVLAPGCGTEWWGEGAMVGAHPLGDADVYWYASVVATPGATSTRPARIADVVARFQGWPDRFLSVVQATCPDGLLRTDLHDLSPLLRWGAGRVTVLGDAAHAMSPVLGQGAATALEDAVVLGQCVARHGCTADALRAYERARRWRAIARAEAAHIWSSVLHTRHPPVAWTRDRMVSLLIPRVGGRAAGR
jgi:2-polyprenyl-6-methoxyphenol hydroxylase-like FAD-dependent oxidoreductase